MINPLFEAWWNTVKDNSEFRGCTMPAAYAAWLAGAANCIDQHTRIARDDIGASETIWQVGETEGSQAEHLSRHVSTYAPEETYLLAANTVPDGRKREGKQGRYRGDKLKGAEEKIKQMENPDAKE